MVSTEKQKQPFPPPPPKKKEQKGAEMRKIQQFFFS